MRKRNAAALAALVIVLACAVPAAGVLLRYHDAAAAARTAVPLRPYDMVHVLLYGYGGETVSGRIALYADDGTEISVVERSWKADAVVLEMARVSLEGKSFVFPYRVAASRGGSGDRGLGLFRYFVTGGECRLAGGASTAHERKLLGDIARFAVSNGSRLFSLRSVQQVSLSLCQPGIEYELRFFDDGSVVVSPVAEVR